MVKKWRRSYDIPPPKLRARSCRRKKQTNFSIDKSYDWPASESLKDTFNRVINFWKKKIENKFPNKNILIVAHGNTIRSIVKYIENISDNNIVKVEIATGQPLIYSYNNSKSPSKNILNLMISNFFFFFFSILSNLCLADVSQDLKMLIKKLKI